MSTKYTPEDVQRLVDAAKHMLQHAPKGGLVEEELTHALAPFQPSPGPDVAAIEAMAQAIYYTRFGERATPWDELPGEWQDEYRVDSRAALAAYRAHKGGTS